MISPDQKTNSRPLIKLRMQNGLTFQEFYKEVLQVNKLDTEFDFVESNDPDFIIFGPYGNDVPPKGNYTRIGYFCENMIPDLSICEWAFGVMHEKEINNPRYKRIDWHAVDPETLVRDVSDEQIERILKTHTRFCNFIYSNQVTYRENFFKILSKYKRVDAPGRSMNNMPGIDESYSGDMWQRKRQFLSEYKFTISFENYCYPGYCTEKLFDAMKADSIPIYCGDPLVGEVFDTNSFLNVPDYSKSKELPFVAVISPASQPTFKDVLPHLYKSPVQRFTRKLKTWGRSIRMNAQSSDFSDLIERIVEIDRDESLYIDYLKRPWFKNNTAPQTLAGRNRWHEIFRSAGT